MTDEQAERLRELEKFATPGPWQGYSEPEVGLPYSLFSGTPMQTGFGPIEPLCPRDIDLIVAMRNALPALLAERERHQAFEATTTAETDALRARVAELEAALNDARVNGLIYWSPITERGSVAKATMLARIDALLARATLGETT